MMYDIATNLYNIYNSSIVSMIVLILSITLLTPTLRTLSSIEANEAIRLAPSVEYCTSKSCGFRIGSGCNTCLAISASRLVEKGISSVLSTFLLVFRIHILYVHIAIIFLLYLQCMG